MTLKIAEPLTLPCGLVLPNRLVKAAMAEQMSDRQYLPDDRFERSYGKWADGGWGLVVTGNVHVDATYLGQHHDTAVNPAIESRLLESWKVWAKACMKNGTPTVVQLNHPGRQSVIAAGKKGFFDKNLAPSPIPLNLGDSLFSRAASCLIFGTPKEMTVNEIEYAVEQFAYSARLVAESGFSGIQIHAAHGYLLAQFLSSNTNKRSDAYGGSPAKRAKIVVDIIHAIRKVVPPSFAVGIKLNSVDHQSKQDVEAFVEQITTVVDAGIDFMEISGGNYENPLMITGHTNTSPSTEKVPSSRTQAREAFFIEFASAIRSHFPSVLLAVTGGFRTRTGMEEALSSGSCDLIGIGRPSCVEPDGAKKILNADIADVDARLLTHNVTVPFLLKYIPIKSVGSGLETKYYGDQIHIMARK